MARSWADASSTSTSTLHRRSYQTSPTRCTCSAPAHALAVLQRAAGEHNHPICTALGFTLVVGRASPFGRLVGSSGAFNYLGSPRRWTQGAVTVPRQQFHVHWRPRLQHQRHSRASRERPSASTLHGFSHHVVCSPQAARGRQFETWLTMASQGFKYNQRCAACTACTTCRLNVSILYVLTMVPCSRGAVPPAEQGRDCKRRRAHSRVQLRGHMYDPGTLSLSNDHTWSTHSRYTANNYGT